jgi:hypothetical protein
MIGVGTSLLFDRKAGKAGPPIPPFNKAMVDAWFMSGLSNADKPGSITGVMGNEMALKNFTYSLSSGFGKYEIDFNSWTKNVNAANFTNSDSVIHLTEILVADSKFLQTSVDATISSYQVKAEGITDDIKLRYVFYAEDGTGTYTYLKNGINNLPISYKKYTGFAASVVGTCNITITQLPSAYEDALVFDGVDDYGICTGLPILDDYTLICRREWIDLSRKSNTAIANKRKVNQVLGGAFNFERMTVSQILTLSFGNYTDIQLSSSDVVYQTKTSYNGDKVISSGSLADTDSLFLGCSGNGIEFANCVIYYFALYNKSLTPEEIETEKERLNEEWLKRSKVTIPEPDVYYDLSLKDNSSPTRNIIDDLSGNGHDAEIFNAAYTESSGYRSDGAFVFDSIDDYAIMQNVTKGFKTLFMEVIPSLTIDKSGFLYDQRVGRTSFGISISLNHIAYNAYNWGGVTYINGKLNTTMNGKEVYLKHQIITIVNGTDLKPQKVVLGGDIGLDGYFSNMALYKLIGFYDELTPLQIEKVINDYKLKHD